MSLGPDRLHTDPIRVHPARKRPRLPKPPVGRVTVELIVAVSGLFATVLLAPLSSRWFVLATAIACGVAVGYAIFGAIRLPGAAAWWGFVWGGKDEDDLARGFFQTGLLFFASLVPIALMKCSIRTPAVSHPAAYLLWCFVQDFLFFSIIERGLERLTSGKVVGHRHIAVAGTALLFGLSHFPMVGFMLATGLIAVVWGYIFQRSRLLWPVTASHFVLGLIVMS